MLTPVGSLLVVNAPTLEISTGLASPAYASVRVETLKTLNTLKTLKTLKTLNTLKTLKALKTLKTLNPKP